jgi:hypothetical protein
VIEPHLRETAFEVPIEVSERRELARLRCSKNRQATLVVRPSFRRYRGVIRDISTQGLGVITGQPFLIGTVVAIRLQRKLAGAFGLLAGTVRHCTPRHDGLWVTGCELSRELTDQEMNCLL